MARRARAKSRSMRGLTWIWPTPASSYSTGSSTVMMFCCRASRRDSAAYSVVVLPEPVGPVTSTMPCGWLIRWSMRARASGAMPSRARSRRFGSLSSRRRTTRSPWLEGSVETRTSMPRPPIRMPRRPSWGRRFSAMSRLAMILMRDTMAACSARFGRTTSRSMPSRRKRTQEWRS